MPRFNFRVSPSSCPYCDCLLDAASNVEGERGPTPGDFTICIGCAQPLIFLADLRVGKPKSGEFEAVCRAHPAFGAAMRATMAAIRRLDRKW